MRTLSILLFLPVSLWGQQSVLAHRSTTSLRNIYSSAPMGANVATNPSTTGLLCWLKPESLGGADGSGISAWADSSGGGCSVAQATAGKQPTVAQNAYFGYTAARFTRESSQYFDVTALAVSSKTFSMFFIVRRKGNNAGTRETVLYGDTTHRVNPSFRSGQYTTSRTASTNENFASPSGLHIATGPMLVGFVEDATAGPNGYWKFGLSEIAQNLVQGAIETENLVTIGGNSVPGEYYGGDLFEVLVYNRVLTPTERAAIGTYADQRYGMTRSGDWQIIFDGNSLASGFNSNDGIASPMTMLQDYFQQRHTWWHESYPGESTEQLTTDAPLKTVDIWIPNGFANTIIIVWELTNSLSNGDTGMQAAAALKAYAVARKAANSNVKVIVATCLPRNGIEAQRGIANQQVMIDFGLGFYDAVADVASDLTIGQAGQNVTATAYYNADQLHLLKPGVLIAYRYFRDAILSLGILY